jgi:hypothetical protein
MPFSFVQDLGHFGQPSEQMFYGLGFQNISYIRDGVLLNNRMTNTYNLNRFNSERVDSIEVSPLTTGFLYSTYNNPVSINFHSRFAFPKQAITQLKFFQASYDEGFVDVLFHTNITNKLNFGIGVSNSAIDSRFDNSDYESWKLDANISYLINDKINITFNYFFTYDTLALFGGLDTSKILNDDFSSVLYGRDFQDSYRYQLNYSNNAYVKVLTTLIPNSKTELTFYANSNVQKFRQNVDTLTSNIPVIVRDNNLLTFGARLQNYYSFEDATLNLTATYETTKLKTDFSSQDWTENILSLSGKVNYVVSKLFVPSFYGKFNYFNNNLLLGYGADVSGIINSSFSYYAGISWFQKQTSILENIYPVGSNQSFPFNITQSPVPTNNNTIEIGIKYQSSQFMGRLAYFNISTDNSLIPNSGVSISDSLLINELSYFTEKSINSSGISFSFSYKFWKFLFSNNLNYFLSTRNERVYASPDYTIAGKLYYFDKLFDNNLAVKAGINYRVTGGQSPFIYDFENSVQIKNELTPLVSYTDVPSSFQLDLFLAGTIQERATIFVTFENLLDTEYYIVPYYFKQPVTLRLGVTWLLYD